MYFFLPSALKTIAILGGCSSALARILGTPPTSPPETLELLAKTQHASAVDALSALQDVASRSFQARNRPKGHKHCPDGAKGGGCRCDRVQKRQDWAHLTDDEKRNYISALQCMLTSPSQSDPNLFPGAKNRYDDFVVVHINQTLSIHGTGNFLTWHRYFTWAYEQALRTECGYAGNAPYWNWFTHADNLSASPIFDGSDTSLSGDGAFFAHEGSDPIATVHLPSGKGGGCVTSGPLVNMTVNLGPWFPAMNGLEQSPDGEFAYNPHCLRRDLQSAVTSQYFTAENLLNLTIGAASKSVSSFQDELQGRFADGFLGMHTTGHVSVGGDASSIFSSITDPSFFLHHAMIDRLYWLWQMLHPTAAGTIGGTITVLNSPPSREAFLDDTVYLSDNLAPPQEIENLLSTTAGPFCYTYV